LADDLIQEKMEDKDSRRQLTRVKTAIIEIKQNLKVMSRQEGLMTNSLFTFKNRLAEHERGKHYLYDIDESPIHETEFTEDDLAHDKMDSARI
jgi:hypothetical protein